MRILKNTLIISAALICALLSVFLLDEDNTYAAVVLKAKAVRPSSAAFTTVRVRWAVKSRKVSYVKLKYGQCKKGKFTGKTKTLKLRKSIKSRIFKKLKKNKLYRFELTAYTRGGKKLKKRIVSKFTGINPPEFDMEYAERSYNYIMFSPDVYRYYCTADPGDNGKLDYTVKRVELYRYTKEDGWKLLTKRARMDFRDNDVEFGKYYKYRFQTVAQAKVSGKSKTLKSPYTYKTIRAANEIGKFSVSFSEATPYAETMPLIELDLVMDQYNDDAVFQFGKGTEKIELYRYWINEYDCECESFEGKLTVKDYRIDDGEWTKAEGDVKVTAGQKLSIRMAPADGAGSVTVPQSRFFLTKALYGGIEKRCVIFNAQGRLSWYLYASEVDY